MSKLQSAAGRSSVAGAASSSVFASRAPPPGCLPLGGGRGRARTHPDGAQQPQGLERVPYPPHPVHRSPAVELDSWPQVPLCASRSAPAAAARPCASLVSLLLPPPPPPPSPRPVGAARAASKALALRACGWRQVFDAAARVGSSERLRGGCRWAGPALAVTHGHAGAGAGPGEACPLLLSWSVTVCVFYQKKIDVTDVSYYTYTQLHDE